MTKIGKTIIIILVLLALGVAVYFLTKTPVVEENTIGAVENNPNLILENQILGKKEDLVAFSILPGTKLPKSILAFDGVIKGAWFFEANILINILDTEETLLKAGNATATSDWMTVEPVAFSGTIDLSGLPTGPAYLEIRNDNPAGPDEGINKNILLPIIIE
ncbi:MAG: Gmad2 immunoglobulin-like domain-containing protein [Candidatus Paceibacterota bacterium]